MTRCVSCGKRLSGDELGLYRKLISRSGDQYLCMDCIARDLGCSRTLLEKKVLQFKKLGCALFPPLEEPSEQ